MSTSPGTSSSRTLWAGVILAAQLSSGCAKVGDPLPPVTTPAEAAAAFDLVYEGEGPPSLAFTVAAEARRVLLIRRCEEEGEEGELPAKVLEASVDELESRPDGRRRLQIPAELLPAPDALPCSFSLVVRNRQGRPSSETAAIPTVRMQAPPAPSGLRSEVTERSLRLHWNPVEATASVPVAGYLVNGRHFTPEATWETDQVSFGRLETFTVQTVARTPAPTVLSPPSEPLTVTPEDRFPPSPPLGLSATAVEGGVQLAWEPPAEADLQGCRVLRGPSASGPFQAVSAVLAASSHLDTSPSAGGVLYYVVTAVDRRGNESAPSAAVSVDLRR